MPGILLMDKVSILYNPKYWENTDFYLYGKLRGQFINKINSLISYINFSQYFKMSWSTCDGSTCTSFPGRIHTYLGFAIFLNISGALINLSRLFTMMSNFGRFPLSFCQQSNIS